MAAASEERQESAGTQAGTNSMTNSDQLSVATGEIGGAPPPSSQSTLPPAEPLPKADGSSAAVVADLWHFYDEHAAQARQHENLRATVTGTLAAIAAAVTALAGVGGLTVADIPAGLVVIIVGGLGVALSLKHFERNRFHAEVMRHVQNEIEKLRRASDSGAGQACSKLWESAKKCHRHEFSMWRRSDEQRQGGPYWVRVRLYFLWAGLPLGIGLVGILVIVLGMIGVSVEK